MKDSTSINNKSVLVRNSVIFIIFVCGAIFPCILFCKVFIMNQLASLIVIIAFFYRWSESNKENER
jgi:hypothetical protein